MPTSTLGGRYLTQRANLIVSRAAYLVINASLGANTTSGSCGGSIGGRAFLPSGMFRVVAPISLVPLLFFWRFIGLGWMRASRQLIEETIQDVSQKNFRHNTCSGVKLRMFNDQFSFRKIPEEVILAAEHCDQSLNKVEFRLIPQLNKEVSIQSCIIL